ncbi:unnamed protein product, partial [Arabidopsis halleri]
MVPHVPCLGLTITNRAHFYVHVEFADVGFLLLAT